MDAANRHLLILIKDNKSQSLVELLNTGECCYTASARLHLQHSACCFIEIPQLQMCLGSTRSKARLCG